MTDFDSDLRSIQQARDLATAARAAMRSFQFTDQEEVDAICEAMTAAAVREAARLGRMAHEETGFGRPDHKRIKNEFAAQAVWDSIKDVRTCGVLRHDEQAGITDIGWPVGVLCALTPSTNPTSTAIYKILIGVKARNAVIVSPHPSAAECTVETVRVMAEAGEAAGMPPGLVSCLSTPTLQGTNELMNHHAVSMILATGGPGMVKAAHSCGKPALGVGPGNVPVYVDRSADVARAAEMIVESKSFDCSTICATEQAVIVDRPVAGKLRDEMARRGAHWLGEEEAELFASRMFRPNGMMHAEYVGRTPQALGRLAGIDVPDSARVLVAGLGGIGPNHPLSREKLTSVLGFMEVDGWQAGRDRAVELLKFGGDGHTMIIHSTDEDAVLAFGIEAPAFRVLVNTWGSLGAVGATTAVRPSMTLAPGGIGGAVVSDNITVEHVLNVKRLARHRRDPDPAARRIDAAAPVGTAGGPRAGSSSDAEAIERVVRMVLEQMREQEET